MNWGKGLWFRRMGGISCVVDNLVVAQEGLAVWNCLFVCLVGWLVGWLVCWFFVCLFVGRSVSPLVSRLCS